MKKVLHQPIIVILFSLILVRIFLQFYKLADVPAGFTWDEAAIGYNGYSVLKTGIDEWLEKYPISFRSFGDYKAPLAIYVVGIFTYFFGLTPLIVRLPFAISGVLSIGIFYLFTLRVFKDLKNSQWYALLATFFLTVSPWHLHFTRVAFESGLSLTFTLSGLVLYFSFLTTAAFQRRTYKNLLFCLGAVIFFSAAVYTYHSAKIVVPLLIIITTIFYGGFSFFQQQWKLFAVSFLFMAVLTFPLVKDMLYGGGNTRANVLIINHQPIQEVISSVSKNYLIHLSPSFLLQGATNTLRHGTGNWGVLFLTTWLLCLLGIFGTIRQYYTKENTVTRNLGTYLFLLIFLGLLPACLSTDVPHANRALLAMPGFLLLGVLGFYYCLEWLKTVASESQYNYTKTFIGLIILTHIFLFTSYWQYYLDVYPTISGTSFQEGYLEAFKIAKDYEHGNNGKTEVDKILFSNEYQEPYIFALFVRKTTPRWYQSGSLIKYEFTDKINEGDLLRPNTLVVGTEHSNLPIEKADQVVYGRDGKVRFSFFVNK